MKARKFPKEILVTWYEDDPPFLSVQEDAEACEHDDKVAIYALQEVRTCVKRAELVK